MWMTILYMIKRSIIIFAIIILASSSLMSMLLPNLLCCYHFCNFDRKPLNHDYVYISFHHYHPCHFLHPYYHQQTSNHKHQTQNSRLEVQFQSFEDESEIFEDWRIYHPQRIPQTQTKPFVFKSASKDWRISQTSNHKPKTQGLRFGLKDKNF